MASQLTWNVPNPTDKWPNADILLWKLLNGQTAIGNYTRSIGRTAVSLVGPPAGAVRALVCLRADPNTVDKSDVCRFWEVLGAIPTATEGLILGDCGTYEIIGEDNIANFRIIGIENGMTHTLNVQYFSY
jgi:hypothetical protein